MFAYIIKLGNREYLQISEGHKETGTFGRGVGWLPLDLSFFR